MTKNIYIIDYKSSSDSEFRYRGERLAKIIDGFSVDNKKSFEAKFTRFARNLGLKTDKENKIYLKFHPHLVLLHQGNELLPEDSKSCRFLIEFCRGKNVPVIVFTGGTPGPGQVHSSRLKNRLDKVLKRLVAGKEKTASETEKIIADVINERALQDDILKHYSRYIKPQLSLLRLTLDGFLMLHGGAQSSIARDVPDIADSHARASASNWAWFSPLLAPNKKHLVNDDDFTSFCRLFTPLFDLKLSELYCLSLAEKSSLPDESLRESLELAFGREEIEKVTTIGEVAGQEYKDLEEIYRAHKSIGKMLVKNARRYSIPLLINPKSPPLSPGEKKYLENFRILDGQFKTTFLNLWSEEAAVLLPSHTRNQLSGTLRQFVSEVYRNRKMIRKEIAVEDIENFKLKIEDVHKELSGIIRYFEEEFGEYPCNI